MKKHYIEAPHEIREEDKKPLPDRSDLSKLYPEQIKGTTSGGKAQSNADDEGDLNRQARRLFLVVGIVIPLPFFGALLLFSLFVQNTSASTIFFFLPVIILTILFWIITVVWLSRKISSRIDKLGVSPIVVLSLHIACLVLLSQPLYALVRMTGSHFLERLLYGSGIMGVSIILAWIFYQVMFSISLSDRIRTTILIIIVTGSLLAAIVYLFSNSR